MTSVVVTQTTINASVVQESVSVSVTSSPINVTISPVDINSHSAVTIGTANGLSLSGQVLSLGLSSALATGALSSADWTTFNNKQNALGYTPVNIASVEWIDLTDGGATILHSHAGSGAVWGAITGTLSNQTDLQAALDAKVPNTRTISTTSPLSGGGDLSANRTIAIALADTSTNGYLSSTDWNTFNNKQAALGYTPVDIASASWIDLTDGGATILHSHAGGSGHVIQDEGTPLTARANINFVGAGVAATDDAGNNATVVTINAGSGDISGTGVVGQVAEFVTDTKTIQAAKIIGPTGAILTLVNASAKSITFPGSTNDTVAMLATANVFTVIQAISGNVGLLVGASALETGTIASFKNISTHTRVGIGSSGASLHSLLSFFNSAGTKKFDIGYDPSNTRFYIFDGTGNVFQSTDAGVTTIGRSAGSVTFGVADLTLETGSASGYFNFNTTGTDRAVGTKYKEASTEKFALAYLGTTSALTDQFAGYGMRLYNNVISYTALAVKASNSWMSLGFGNPAVNLHIRDTAAGTNAVRDILRLEATVVGTGVGAAGLGTGISFFAETATDTTNQQQGLISTSWIVATNATRTAKMNLSAYDTAARLGLTIEASGTAAMLSFYGGTTVVRGAALTTQLTTITHTSPGTPDYAIQDMVVVGPWGFATQDEGNTVLSVIRNLQIRVAELEARLGSATGVNLFA